MVVVGSDWEVRPLRKRRLRLELAQVVGWGGWKEGDANDAGSRQVAGAHFDPG